MEPTSSHSHSTISTNVQLTALMQEPIPGYNGGGNYLANVGRIDNKGLDFSINAHLIQTKDWQWNSTLTGTYLKMK